MFNMIKSDVYRLIKSKALYIAIAIIIIMSLLSIIGMSAGNIGLKITSSNLIDDPDILVERTTAKSLKEYRNVMKEYGHFELDKEIIGQNANLYYIFIIIVAIILTRDFSNKTIKNTLSSAINRKKYYISKTLIILGTATCLILFNNYFTYFINIAINGKEFSSTFGEIAKLTLYQLPILYGIICLLICFAFITKKASIFNAISIPFVMIFQIVILTITSLFKIQMDIFTNYEFQNALFNLAYNPTNEYILKCSLLGTIYIILFSIIGYYSFKSTEIN